MRNKFFTVPLKLRGRKLTYRVLAASEGEAQRLAQKLARRFEKPPADLRYPFVQQR